MAKTPKKNTAPGVSARFFESEAEFRKWLTKNSEREKELWVGFYKKGLGEGYLDYSQASDLCLCFGWIIATIKRIDHQCFKVRCMKRRPQGVWSDQSIERFKFLKKKTLVHKRGLESFKNRKKSPYEGRTPTFSSSFLRRFKSNKKAWKFFTSQTASYQKYTTMWVMTAKRAETQEKRFSELLADSSKESKLSRILAAHEKTKPVYEPGKTPIEAGQNLGFVSGAELRSVGIETLERLKDLGWEEAFNKLIELYPQRMNLNMLGSLMGAVEEQSYRKLDPALKFEAKQYLKHLKRGHFDSSTF